MKSSINNWAVSTLRNMVRGYTGRVGYGRRVVARHLVGIGQCGGVGHTSREQTHDGVVVELVTPATYDADNHHGDKRDKEAPQYP